MDDDVEDIFNLPLAEIIVKCDPEINSYLNGAFLRFNQSALSLYPENELDSITQHPLNQTNVFMATDWSTMVSSAVPTPAGILRNHQQQHTASQQEDMQRLKYYSYGIALPAICVLGILGNVLNLIVLTRPTMRGPAYVYMRGNCTLNGSQKCRASS